MKRSLLVLLLLAQFGSLSGEQTLSLPDWLGNFPTATNLTTKASAKVVELAYTAAAPAEAVLAHYEKQLRAPGVKFNSSFNGIGITMWALSADKSCTVRLTEDRETNVAVTCVLPAESKTAHDLVPKEGAVSVPPPPDKLGALIEHWPPARWGMTQQQVIDAFQGRAKTLVGDERGRRFMDQLATIGIESTILVGVSFRALFLFKDAALDRIILRPPTSAVQTHDLFRSLEAHFVRKHGPPLRGTDQVNFDSAWLLPNSVLTISSIPGTSLNVILKQRKEDSAESIMDGLEPVKGVHVLPRIVRETPLPPGVHRIEYIINGSAFIVAATYRNASGGTEQREFVLPESMTFLATAGSFIYLSAQNKGDSGCVHVEILVDGRRLQEATSSGSYGIATVSGSVRR